MKSKVILVYKDIEDEIAEEVIWAEELENGYYRIDNIPFYAPNLAYNDVIAVEDDEGVLYFDNLIKSSGHSTVQIIFFKEIEAKRVLPKLESLGCNWEGIKDQPYYSIDIPPNINYSNVKQFLDEQSENKILDYKESCLA
ncbi:MAG: DUF4265 domain-containing protein [Lewinellaceae bacterium]|nr:DUF4265 domain-containing protein [Lewinellaceae bacterium]